MEKLNEYKNNPVVTSLKNYPLGQLIKARSDSIVARGDSDTVDRLGELLGVPQKVCCLMMSMMDKWSAIRLHEKHKSLVTLSKLMVQVLSQADFVISNSMTNILTAPVKALLEVAADVPAQIAGKTGKWKLVELKTSVELVAADRLAAETALEAAITVLLKFLKGDTFSSKMSAIQVAVSELQDDFVTKIKQIRNRLAMWSILSAGICELVDMATEYEEITDYDKDRF
jgi:hypothetical protein